MNKNEIVELIASTVEGFRMASTTPAKPIRPDTQLFGPSGLLDSLGLVSVLVEIEQRIADLGVGPVSLMDDRAMSERSSPFRTVGTLADYITRQLTPGSGS